MDFLNNISVQIIFFGAGLSLLLSLSEALQPSAKDQPPIYRRPLVWIGISVFSILLRTGLFLDRPEMSSWWYFTLFASIYAAAPLLTQMARQMVDAAFEGNPPPPFQSNFLKSPFLYSPVAIVLIVELTFQLKPLEERRQILENIYETVQWNSIDLGMLTGIGLNIVCFGLLVYFVYRVGREYHVTNLPQALSFFVLPFLASCFLFVGYFCKHLWLIHAGGLGIALTIVLAFLYIRKYPDFFQSLQREIQKERYVRTQLTGLDLDSILQRLQQLMEEQKLFLDPDLRLSDLAEELSVSSHQLSRILNENHNQNFNAFLNSFRIAEARTLLVEEPEKTIISIAFDVGFNTKSAFNDQFSRHTGMTPAQYRKKNLL